MPTDKIRGPDLKRARRRKPETVAPADLDRLPPHSPEAEQGVLGCILLETSCLDECRRRGLRAETFYDLRHATIFDALEAVRLKSKNNGARIDVISLQQHLKDHGLLEQVGGISYLSTLPDTVPSAANLSYYLDIICEKWELRKTVQTCTEVINRIYDHEGDVEELLWATRSDLQSLTAEKTDSAEQVWTVRQLNNFDASQDPNALVGLRDGQATRYLCRGYGAWLIGPSGVGKSSLIHQAAVSWVLGKPMCGIAPLRPLKVLIIQAENDEGDAAEMTQGILRSFGIDEMDPVGSEQMDVINQNLHIITERRTVGDRFCSWLRKKIEEYQAEIVFADPFLSFAGVDVNRQDACTKFLRANLNPVLSDTGAVLFAAHHTGKPKQKQDMKSWTAVDYAYAGIGSSELVNWARAVMVLLSLGDAHHFELKLAKRGLRAGATHPSGEFTTSIFLRHATDRIFWQQVDAPQEGDSDSESWDNAKPKKLPQHEIICNLAVSTKDDTGGFLKGCVNAGETATEIRRRLRDWLVSKHCPKRIHFESHKAGTIRRAVANMVEEGLLKCIDERYYIL